MQPIERDLTILQGATFQYAFQWFEDAPRYLKIAAIEPGLPTVITIPTHGLPASGRWPVWITNVVSLRGLNSEAPGHCEPWFATAIDENTLAIEANTGGQAQPGRTVSNEGVLTYFPPKDLTGYTGRMQVRTSPRADTALLDLSTTGGGIVIEPATGLVTLRAPASDTAAITWAAGVYDLELTDADGFVTRLAAGDVSVSPQVTRP